MTVKMRKVGHSWVLTVSEKDRKEKENKEFEAYTGHQGAIVFLPVSKNPFESKETITKYGSFDGDTTGFVDGGASDEEIKQLFNFE